MKRILFFSLILQFFHLAAYSQVKGIVINKSTGKPVSFTNIWVENENIGVTSEEDGTFLIDKSGLENKYLILTCVGYEKTRVLISEKFLKIEMLPKVNELKEVVISPSGGKRSQLLPDIGSYYANEPWIVARFFPYKEEYDAKPYINKISYLTSCIGKTGKYRIRIFGVNDRGEPGADLITDQLIYDSKTGTNKITIDLEKYRLKIPPSGFFIGFEWLSTRENKRQKISIWGFILKDTSQNWGYISGRWRQTRTNNQPLSFRLIIELMLGENQEKT